MFKKVFAVVISFVLVLGISPTIFADESNHIDKSNAEMNLVDIAYNDIKDQIINDYGQLYKLDNFSYDFATRQEQGQQYFDIDIYVDMTLTRHPAESPFVKGMQQALVDSTDEAEKEMLQKEIDTYVSEIQDEYLNIPNRSTFTYSIGVNNMELFSSDQTPAYQIYYRTDTENEVVLIENEKLAEVENEAAKFQEGYNVLDDMKFSQSLHNTLAAVTYDRAAARDWARDNYNEDPEYPSKNVGGTDCANFVSKAINNGGIPQDKKGKWYQAATWGGWPGDHWFRTGYNGSTGVTIYMKDKGYFSKESKESKVNYGSIMYWNKTSHVALVTYADGSTIKYTQHGAKQTKDTVYKSENASFFVPTSKILK